MKLEDYIFSCIFAYPSLYHTRNFEESKKKVLDHLFLVIGSGVEYVNPKNLPHKGYFSDGSKNKKRLSKEVKQRIISGEPIVTIYNKIDQEKFDKFGMMWPDRESKEQNMLLDDFRNLKMKYYNVNERYSSVESLKQKIDLKDYEVFIETYPDRMSDYEWSPYPFSIEYTPFWEGEWDKKKGKLIDKNLIRPDWVEGIVWIYKVALQWFEDDNKWGNDRYFNWAGKNWAENNNNLVIAWNKESDKVKLCKDYEIPFKPYSSPKEMAEDIVNCQRSNYIEEAKQIIEFYS
jgi:hypothetical protein